jgi:hypothetical protein
MNIGVPAYLVVGMAALFSAYHLVTAVYEMQATGPVPIAILAMALYALATAAVLVPHRRLRLPWWAATVGIIVAIAVPLMVRGFESPVDSYPRWFVPAVGTLLTILATRRRASFAWIGIASLVVLTAVDDGPLALVTRGVGVVVAWVAVAHVLSRAMLKADADARRFALAEQEAAEWQAAQEAHVYERQFRLGQTSSMALSMLRRIERTGGELSDEERQECLRLEAAIRDEIRGRRLLSDAVREQVMLARRSGAVVTLLDEGGLDELDDVELDRVHDALAAAIAGADANKIIVRTVSEDSEVAVTVVGLRSAAQSEPTDGVADDDEDDEMTLWLEIPRGTPITG